MRRYISNSVWILLERLISIGLVFAVTVFTARYLGPSNFGTLSYVLAVSSMFFVVGQFGLENVVIRDLVSRPSDEPEILGTSFVLKLITFLTAVAAMIVFAFIAHSTSTERLLFLVASLHLLVTPLLTTHSWFNAHVMARSAAIAGVAGNVISSASRLGFVFIAASVVFFAASNFIQTVISAIVSFRLFGESGGPSVRSWTFSAETAKKILSESWIFFLGSFFSIVYLKMDIAILRWLAGPAEAGLYTVAAQVSEAGYFVPGAILASIFPAMIRLRELDQKRFEQRLQQVFDVMLLLSIGIMVPLIFAGLFVIPLLFGREFQASSEMLVVHVFAMPFIFMGTAFIRWMLIERMTKFFLLSQGIGVLVNASLNLTLIPSFGGIGAAIATVISYAVALYLVLLFDPRTRPIFFMMSSSIFKPWGTVKRAYAIRSELQ